MPLYTPAASGGAVGSYLLSVPLGNLTQSLWNAMPAALVEWPMGSGSTRHQIDLSGVTQARLFFDLFSTGYSTSELRVQYWDGAAWQYLDGVDGPKASLSVVLPQAQPNPWTVAGAWATIVAAARTSVTIRVVGIGGNGVVTPTFVFLYLQVR